MEYVTAEQRERMHRTAAQLQKKYGNPANNTFFQLGEYDLLIAPQDATKKQPWGFVRVRFLDAPHYTTASIELLDVSTRNLGHPVSNGTRITAQLMAASIGFRSYEQLESVYLQIPEEYVVDMEQHGLERTDIDTVELEPTESAFEPMRLHRPVWQSSNRSLYDA
jgi:hypothetical protein